MVVASRPRPGTLLCQGVMRSQRSRRGFHRRVLAEARGREGEQPLFAPVHQEGLPALRQGPRPFDGGGPNPHV